MIYIGHFSYDELDEQESARHGYFSCVVDAGNSEEAAALFTFYILEMKKTEFIFANVAKVYIEDIVEIPEIPRTPMVTTIQSCEGEFPKTISYSLPFKCPEGVEAFGLPTNVKRHEKIESEDYLENEPFIAFKDPYMAQPKQKR